MSSTKSAKGGKGAKSDAERRGAATDRAGERADERIGEPGPEDYPPYQYAPEAGSEWPPPEWLPPYVYDHEISYDHYLEGAAPEPEPQS